MKINHIINSKHKDQKIIFRLKSRVPFLDYSLIIIPVNGIIITLLFLAIKGNLWISSNNYDIILNFLTYLGILSVSIILMLWGFIFLDHDYISLLITEKKILILRRISVVIKKDPHHDEIKLEGIGFITFKEKKGLLKNMKVYRHDLGFEKITDITERRQIEKLKENISYFQINFRPVKDADISKKLLDFLIQNAKLKQHSIIKSLYFSSSKR